MKLTPRTLPRYLPLCLLACVSPSSATAQNATLRYTSGSSFTPVLDGALCLRPTVRRRGRGGTGGVMHHQLERLCDAEGMQHEHRGFGVCAQTEL